MIGTETLLTMDTTKLTALLVMSYNRNWSIGDSMGMKRKADSPIYTMDIETDPFKHGRLPKPFAVGIYGNEIGYQSFWHSRYSRTNVIDESVKFLDTLEPGFVFLHNGGRFDLFYYLEHLREKMLIVNNRIVVSYIGKQEVRDSFAIMPFSLAKYSKDKKDKSKCHRPSHIKRGLKCTKEPYAMFEAKYRDEHKTEILDYLCDDVKDLHTLCSSFVQRFGPRITIGGTAINELKQDHTFQKLSESDDNRIRTAFYFGGRVQCFEKGVIKTNVKVYDVNSMYPYVMQHYKHPIGEPLCTTRKISSNTFFVTVTGVNYGAFPQRTETGTRFDGEFGTYNVTIHEWETACNLNLFRTHKIEQAIDFADSCSFEKFVTRFYSEREASKISGDVINNWFCKFILNSAYGRFAINPENYYDYQIGRCDFEDSARFLREKWEPVFVGENKYIIYRKPSKMGDKSRLNVATAASITGAARSVLLAAIAQARRPIYCDTDSLICEEIHNVPIDKTKLGAWKLEECGDRVAIAGRKLYAVFKGKKCVKQASKGVKLSPQEIEAVAKGKVIVYQRPVPSFKWDGSHEFITRKVRLT